MSVRTEVQREGKRVIRGVLILITLMVCSIAYCYAQDNANVWKARVVAVENGNTIIVTMDNKNVWVRLIGTAAPTQELNRQSRDNLATLISNKDVSVLLAPAELQDGKNRLLLGKVFLGDVDVGLEQVRSGFAWQSREFEKYQTQDEMNLYSVAEKDAVKAKRGVWREGFRSCKQPAVQTVVGADAQSRPKNTNLPHVYGTAVVEVKIAPAGNVVAARALCGHPILQTVAAGAALSAKFKPQPNPVKGTMVYNFVPE